MANEFSVNDRVKLIAGEVYENVPYVKKAVSYMSQEQTKDKKNGQTFRIYIPDPGKTIDGIVADPDGINEREVEVTLTAANNSCTVNLWDRLTNIEDFTKEIAKPRGLNLGRSIEKKCIENTVFNAAQAVVGSADPATLAKASTMLDEVDAVGTRVAFLKPTTEGKITSNVKFYQGDEIQKNIYKNAYIGEFAGASVIRESLMPIVKGDGSSATLTFTPVSGEGTKSATVVGYAPVVSASGLKKGQAYKIDGLKIVNLNGVQTDQDYVIVATADNKFPEIRVTVDGEAHNNPNAWVATGVLTGAVDVENMLTSGKEYYVGQIRTEDAVGFDTYRFDRIPGTEETTEDVKNIRIKCSIGGDNIKGESSVVFRAPYAVTLPEQRKAVVAYFEK